MWFFLASTLAVAFSSSQADLAVATEPIGSKANPDSPMVEHTTPDGTLVVEVDLDQDKRPEIFNYYRVTGDARVLLRKEVDLNRDGKIDVRSYYTETGVLEKEEIDTDFDGNFDWVDHYKSGKRAMSEVDLGHTGRFDMSKYYEDGKIARIERDANGDGKVDFWEYFDANGNVVKTGRDIDGDGIMDVREE